MIKRDLAKRVEGMANEVGEKILNDQRVATDGDLVRITYAALGALVDLHNQLDAEEQLLWPEDDSKEPDNEDRN
jgi:hypothetical protein